MIFTGYRIKSYTKARNIELGDFIEDKDNLELFEVIVYLPFKYKIVVYGKNRRKEFDEHELVQIYEKEII